MYINIITSDAYKRRQAKQENNFINTKFKLNKNNMKNSNNLLSIKTVRTSDSEAFKILKTFYLVSDEDNPHLEFKQVKKGVFKNENLKNIFLKISDFTIDGYKGCIMDIIDTKNKTKVMSKFLEGITASPEYPLVPPKRLILQDFKNDYIDSDYCVSFLEEFYISAKFKSYKKKFFEFRLAFYDNNIMLYNRTFYGDEYDKVNDDSKAQFLLNFDEKYIELYNEDSNLFENLYLDFFIK